MDRILVVDDSAVICVTLTRWLERAGFEARAAGSAEDALAAVAALPPELILLDLTLPGMSGMELFRALKGNDETARIPVVILTASIQRQDRITCFEMGAEDFLTKPVEWEELIARVRSLLRAKRLSDRLLISFLELDKLGRFAEAFATQSIADWHAVEVADNMARQILGAEPGLPNHPQVVCGGQVVGERAVVRTCCWSRGGWSSLPVMPGVRDLREELRPFDRGDGHYVSKLPPGAGLCELLRLPGPPAPANFVALWRDRDLILAAGYPWEVGAYEFPLLRAALRHWAVFERLRHEAKQAEEAFFRTIEALALAAEFYDAGTASHVRRVGAFSREVARALGCDPHFMKWIERSAQVHDVGKMTVPLDLVLKQGRLSGEETAQMARHTVNGALLLGRGPQLAMPRAIARSHHENWDGSGYPDGLRAGEIPLAARIVRVADVYDALRTARPYKASVAHEPAIHILREGDQRVRPTFWDPTVLEAFLDHQEEIARLYDALHAADRTREAEADPSDPALELAADER